MPRGWRLTKTARAADAFDGEGAWLYGGRWNSPGTRVVYTAQSESLAALELLVHMRAGQHLLSYSSIPADFDEAMIETVDPESLSPRWTDPQAPAALQAFGDRWAGEGRSVVLQAPSAVVPGERIYVFNPLHRDFRRVKIGAPRRFGFDPRLK
jgi:RES domain-containing protein